MKAGLKYDNVSVLLLGTPVEHREQLKKLLRSKSRVRGRFVLSSGDVSDYYIDCKLTTMSPEGAVLTGYTILDLLEQNDIDADAIGGPEIGAIPIVAAVAAVSYLRATKEGKGHPLPAFLVRKERKPHGLEKQIEGVDLDCKKIRRVVIVDEVCTKGESIQVALRAVEEEGLEVVAVISLVDRQQGGHIRLREKYGSRYLPVFTSEELLESKLENAVASPTIVNRVR